MAKGQSAEQWKDKLSRDLPSRSSLDRLDAILFNLSTSSRHEEDRTQLTGRHRAVHNTYLCSPTFKWSMLSSLRVAICFCEVLLRIFVWMKATGPLYLLATVATNTEVCSLLPGEEERWKKEQREPRNDPNIPLNSEIDGKTRHQSS